LSLFDVRSPLAARMRPRTLEEFVGQAHLLAPGRPLGDAIRAGTVGSMIFWGPPGSGKTSLAHLIARYTDRHFVPFSAVTEGVARVREIIAESEQRRSLGRGTILFCDEIHRFNRAQQDAFLPHVERGVITLVGATTENPSFELTGALLSRTRVYVLDRLSAADIGRLLEMALEDRERGLGELTLTAEPGALAALAEAADGDARRALGVLEAAADRAGPGGVLAARALLEVMAARIPTHDKSGEEHFNILSAYHKSLRGSDPQGALYWMARLIEGGEDPMTIFRRAIAMASEDVGLADPQALTVAIAGREAWHQLGAPEGYLALAEVTIYLATAPKSNRVYRALQAAREAARQTSAAPVPLHLRNAPTGLMQALGYGAAYQYPHDLAEGFSPQRYLPPEVGAVAFYQPGSRGFEKKVAERLAWWETVRDGGTGSDPSGTPPGAP